MSYYILNKKEIVPATVLEWAEFVGTPEKVIKQEVIVNGELKIRISTIFLGLDHGFGNSDKPVLFETMIFGGELNDNQYRCCTYDEALEQHKIAIDDILENARKREDYELMNIIVKFLNK